MALHVFPPNVTQPRKSSLKKSKSGDISGSTGELKGVAFQVNTTRSSPGMVRPGNEQIKHSLFCDSTTSNSDTTSESLGRHQRSRKRSSASSLVRVDTPLAEDEDELSPLPENTTFGSTSPATRLKPAVERPTLPITVSTEVHPGTDASVSPGGDRLSPLPSKSHFSPTSPLKSEFPSARSQTSNSPTLVYGESPAISVPPYSPGDLMTSRSIFPQYDHTKPLNQQKYYSNVRSTTPTLPREKVSKFTTSADDKKHAFPTLDMQHVNPAEIVVVGYEHIPIAHRSDLEAVCNASCGNFPVAGRKALFRLLQPRGGGTSLGVGISEDALLYSMDKTSCSDSKTSNELLIAKHSSGSTSSCTVAQLVLPDPAEASKPGRDDVVSIFPQMAAINAIETIANSPVGSEIAKVDPTAASPEAARMAQDAVWEAHRRYRSLLVRAYRNRECLGAVTATYNLEHPTLGTFAITVTKSTDGRSSRDPRAKISLHHPSATPAAVTAETLVLAFLDFGKDACVLDVPGLLALEGSYVIDTVICALLAVAVVENDALMAELITFDAPPKSPLPAPKRQSRGNMAGSESSSESKRSSRFWRRNKKKKEVEDDLPALTQGALALLGLSFKMAIWTLEVGARIGVGVIIATTKAVAKA